MADYIKRQFQKCFDTIRKKLLQVFMLITSLVLKQLSFPYSLIFNFLSRVNGSCTVCSLSSLLSPLSSFLSPSPCFPVHLWHLVIFLISVGWNCRLHCLIVTFLTIYAFKHLYAQMLTKLLYCRL